MSPQLVSRQVTGHPGHRSLVTLGSGNSSSGSALEKHGWRWKGQPARPYTLWEALTLVPCPGQGQHSRVPRAGSCHPHPSSSHCQDFGSSLLPDCSTPAIKLGDIQVRTDGRLLWYLLLIFPAARGLSSWLLGPPVTSSLPGTAGVLSFRAGWTPAQKCLLLPRLCCPHD